MELFFKSSLSIQEAVRIIGITKTRPNREHNKCIGNYQTMVGATFANPGLIRRSQMALSEIYRYAPLAHAITQPVFCLQETHHPLG